MARFQTDPEEAPFLIVQAARPIFASGQLTHRDWIAGRSLETILKAARNQPREEKDPQAKKIPIRSTREFRSTQLWWFLRPGRGIRSIAEYVVQALVGIGNGNGLSRHAGFTERSKALPM